MTKRDISVLVVDDDDVTTEIVERALRKVDGSFVIVPAKTVRRG